MNTGRSISRFGDDTVCILSFLPLTLPKSSVFYREIVYELELHGSSSFDILMFFFFLPFVSQRIDIWGGGKKIVKLLRSIRR